MKEDIETEWRVAAPTPEWWVLRSWRPLRILEHERWQRVFVHGGAVHDEIGAHVTQLHAVANVQGFMYVGPCEVGEDEIAARQGEFKTRIDNLERSGHSLWEAEVKPTVVRLLRDLTQRRRRVKKGTQTIEYLRAALEAEAFVMGDLHSRLTAAAALWDWPATFVGITGRDSSDAAVLLQSLDHETSRLTRRLSRLGRLAQAHTDGVASPAFEAAMRSFLANYGQRTGTGYGSVSDVDAPTWSMQPQMVRELVERYARADLDRMVRARATAGAARRKLHQRILDGLGPEARVAFEAAYGRAIRGVVMMEDHNHFIEQRTYGLFREAVHDAGNYLVAAGIADAADDAFHFSTRELSSFASGETSEDEARDLLRQRQDDIRRRKELRPPRTLGNMPVKPSTAAPASPARAPRSSGEVRGQPGSPGVVTGRARVVSQTTRLPDVDAGDVLVVSNAGPDWTPLFPLLGGIVLDRGTVTQHAAVVAREFAIPAVVGTGDGTKRISDGQWVRVDGSAGTVTQLSDR